MIVLGRIVAPFGVQGWVRVHPFGDDPLSWKKMPQWWLGTDPDGSRLNASNSAATTGKAATS